MRSLLLFAVLALVTVELWGAEPIQLYVAPGGRDTWSGRLSAADPEQDDGPLATLIGARDVIRKLRAAGGSSEIGVVVTIRGGTYVMESPLELTQIDSGTKKAPVVYRVLAGETVRLLAGRLVTKWHGVTRPQVLERLDPSARANVVQVDLRALGVTDYGSPAGGGLELFFADQPMTLARWPNDEFVRMTEVLGSKEVDVRGTKGCVEGIFRYEGDRPKRWLSEKDGWVHGYWFWDWAEQRHPIQSIDVERQRIELKPPYHNYGYRKGQWYYAFNLLSEIDQPGEWYVDRDEGQLYFWPPSAVEQSEAMVSVLPTLITMKDVSFVTLRGLTFEGTRGTALSMSGGAENRVLGCTVRNVGSWAMRVAGGMRHGIVGCDMYQLGAGGISLSGGDRKSLTPAKHFATNNHVHHFARIERVYRPGITLQGVGNRAQNNLIHDAPHMGMGFGGNDHVIERNEIHSVCYESNDAGAIYTGRNWTMRGTVIRNNFLHHINGFEGRGCVGVYLDDMFCGVEISGNVFYRVTRAAFIGGGRDCLVENNLFVDCNPALHVDARALGWAKYHADTWVQEGEQKGTLSGIAYREPPYRIRYPRLVTILEEEPRAPRGNRVIHNVSFGGKWDGVYRDARNYVALEDNLVDQDPSFATPDRIGEGKQPRAIDFALNRDSPAWDMGFKKLPLSRIGLYKDRVRASWPVTHKVR